MGMTLTFCNGGVLNVPGIPHGDKFIASGVCSYLAESSEVSVAILLRALKCQYTLRREGDVQPPLQHIVLRL